MEYFKLLFYYYILKCNLNKINKTFYFQCAKNDVKSIKQHTWIWNVADKYMYLQ